jgi:hypothetical protein
MNMNTNLSLLSYKHRNPIQLNVRGLESEYNSPRLLRNAQIWNCILFISIFMTKPDFLSMTRVSDLDQGRLPAVSIEGFMAFPYSVHNLFFIFLISCGGVSLECTWCVGH